jgi:hypothetical protein
MNAWPRRPRLGSRAPRVAVARSVETGCSASRATTCALGQLEPFSSYSHLGAHGRTSPRHNYRRSTDPVARHWRPRVCSNGIVSSRQVPSWARSPLPDLWPAQARPSQAEWLRPARTFPATRSPRFADLTASQRCGPRGGSDRRLASHRPCSGRRSRSRRSRRQRAGLPARASAGRTSTSASSKPNSRRATARQAEHAQAARVAVDRRRPTSARPALRRPQSDDALYSTTTPNRPLSRSEKMTAP